MKARHSIFLATAAAVGLGLAATAFAHGPGYGYGYGAMHGGGPRADCPYAQQAAQDVQRGPHMGWRGMHRYDQRGPGLRDGSGPRENCPFFQQAPQAPEEES